MLSVRKVSESEGNLEKGKEDTLGRGPLFPGAHSSLYGDSRQRGESESCLLVGVRLLGEQGFPPKNSVQPVDCTHYHGGLPAFAGASMTLSLKTKQFIFL